MKKLGFRKTRLLAATALGLAGAMGLNQAAHASGFGLREGSADWLGNAFTGGEAKAYDAGTVYSNPAGMALLDQNQFSGNVSYIAPSAKFNGTDTIKLNGSTYKAASGQTGNAVSPAASGAIFGVFVLNPDWRVGFSVTNPYGERTAYGADWVGRYQSLVSSITGVDFSLALSYKINNQLSIGGGPVVEYYQARLTQAINSPLLSRGSIATNGSADVHGSDVALGYNLGVLYKIDDDTRVGLDYRSRIRHNITGTEAIGNMPYSPSLGTVVSISPSMSARTTVTSPDSLTASLYHQVTPALALMGTVQWTHWDLFNSLHITPASGTGTTIQENWRNTWFAGVGANYKVNDRLMLQTGFSFDESPVTDSNRTSRVPDANHYNLGVGLKYALTHSTTINLAYLHVFTPGGSINSTTYLSASPQEIVTDTLSGNYSASDNSVTVGINYVF